MKPLRSMERYRVSTYSVRDGEMFKCDPHPLHKGAKAVAEKGDIRIACMQVGGIKGSTSATKMVLLSRIHGRRHELITAREMNMINESMKRCMRMSYLWRGAP
jgi:hypothetical protein